MRRLIVLLTSMIVAVAACGTPQSIDAGHTAGISCGGDGAVHAVGSQYNGGEYSLNGQPAVSFQGGFNLSLDGTKTWTITVTANDWPTFTGSAGPCEQPTTTTTKPPPPSSTTTTSTTSPPSSTSTSTTSTTAPPTTIQATTTTKPPTPGLFAIEVNPVCPDGTAPEIVITFGDRPDLDGQTGTLTFSTGGSIPLTFDANGATTIAYPASAGTGPVTMTYVLGAESVTRSTTFPEACTGATTTTRPGATTTTAATTTTTPGATTTTTRPPTPSQFSFGAAATVCVREVPTIRIVFQNTFPELAGRTGTLTMSDVNGNVVSTQALVYNPGTTVDLLYPGTKVNADGAIADVPGWNLNSAGFWVRDPSDAYLREGINLRYEVNPTATAFVTYPPESAACANPDGPFPPNTPTPAPGVPFSPPVGGLPPTL